ncbi:putative cell cycle control protein cdc123 [Phaeomoniella chlamydospora]|uniref:Putative cell cycle control protein cdc123 n=1 Tax=Phaeomoniella chlamydospora TaxID=158046 RepID=A0A0G2G8S0_PHACM|nr:putative cell cycle control protein cdc123 [Phaeomoniella chlamydospora]
MEAQHETEPFEPLQALPFPPLHKSHILHCSYHHWYPKLRAHTPKARLIALSAPFLDYLRSDGIVLPPETQRVTSDDDSGIFSTASSEADDEDEDEDPSEAWPDIHHSIKSTISELGGRVVPKLNWSAPKDATWMSATNDMDCRSANDIYLLLKSSDFVTHDLEHAFDDCVEDGSAPQIPYHLILRKSFNLNPALEFRCCVRDRRLLAVCQRDQNHFDFLFPMKDDLLDEIEDFLQDILLPAFGREEPNFVFDVYIPPPHDRVWLIDINPWAQRTDPLLFSWLELLTMPSPPSPSSQFDITIRIPMSTCNTPPSQSSAPDSGSSRPPASSPTTNNDDGGNDEEDIISTPIFRLINRDDPEAYQFASTKYSAHKLPKDVVDASIHAGGPGGMNEIMEQWKKAMNGETGNDDSESDDDDAETVS